MRKRERSDESARVPIWLRLILRLYARPFREEHAVEVAEFVRLEERRLGTASRWKSLRFHVHLLLDLLRGALRSRARQVTGGHETGGSGRRRMAWPGDVVSEMKQGVRSLVRSPLFTATVVITLSVGIGLSTAVFSVLDAVLLRPLPFRAEDRLVHVGLRMSGASDVLMAGGAFRSLQERTLAFEELAGIATIRQNLTGTEYPRQVEVGWASPNVFDLLGVRAHAGRVFRQGDPMGTAVLGHRAWRRDFGADPEVVGRTVKLDGYTYTIVGVLPPDLEIPVGRAARDIDIWKVPDRWWQNGDVWSMDGSGAGLLRVIGRLRPDVDITAAEADLDRVASGLRAEVADYRTNGFELSAEPLRQYVSSRSRPVLVLLMATVMLLLLIVCANVTGLMLVRAESRQQDVALRLAMGSSNGRVVRHLMAESLILAAAGAVPGVFLGALGTVLLPRLAPPDLPRLGEVSIDGRVLTFVLAVSAGCTLLFGLAPALQAARRGARAGLMRARATADRNTRGMRHLLVVGQIAASLALLVCAGLFVATLDRLQRVSTGFDESNVLTFAVSLPGKRYGWPVEADQFYQRVSERIDGLPGVESSAVIWPVPLSGKRWDGGFRGGDVEESDNLTVRYELATAGFFETMHIPLLDGGTFGAADPKRGVIVSRRLAERAWPGRSAIGQRLRAFPWGRDTVHFEVIGVAGDVRYESLRREATDVIYFDSRGYVWTDWEVNFVVRAVSDFTELAASIRRELAALDAEIPVADVKPLSDYVGAELASIRFARTLFVLFAGIAAFLAAIGLYGVVAYGVRRRQREFGIRMTLGSAASDVVRMVVREGVLLTLAGAGLGVLLAAWGTDLLGTLLFGVSRTNPVVYGLAVAGLLLVGVIASLVPALRATRVHPASVLRAD